MKTIQGEGQQMFALLPGYPEERESTGNPVLSLSLSCGRKIPDVV